ncbi:MAG: DUF433 domain-containing protein [Microgenomates group bacterium]
MPDIIQTSPRILGGLPVIKGTRIPVSRVIALFLQGYTLPDFHRDYPYLKLSQQNLSDLFGYYQVQLATKPKA